MASKDWRLELDNEDIGALLFAISFARFEHPNITTGGPLDRRLAALRERLVAVRMQDENEPELATGPTAA